MKTAGVDIRDRILMHTGMPFAEQCRRLMADRAIGSGKRRVNGHERKPGTRYV